MTTMLGAFWFPLFFVALGPASAKQQQLEPLTKFRTSCIAPWLRNNSMSTAAIMYSCSWQARRTGKHQMVLTVVLAYRSCVEGLIVIALFPGRLCAAAYVHNSQAFAVPMDHLRAQHALHIACLLAPGLHVGS